MQPDLYKSVKRFYLDRVVVYKIFKKIYVKHKITVWEKKHSQRIHFRFIVTRIYLIAAESCKYTVLC